MLDLLIKHDLFNSVNDLLDDYIYIEKDVRTHKEEAKVSMELDRK